MSKGPLAWLEQASAKTKKYWLLIRYYICYIKRPICNYSNDRNIDLTYVNNSVLLIVYIDFSLFAYHAHTYLHTLLSNESNTLLLPGGWGLWSGTREQSRMTRHIFWQRKASYSNLLHQGFNFWWYETWHREAIWRAIKVHKRGNRLRREQRVHPALNWCRISNKRCAC